jgi:hypothetical protein
MLTPKECEDARRAHKKMLSDSRNSQWDYGPELMDLVADMVLAFKMDIQGDDFYTKALKYNPDDKTLVAIEQVFTGDFQNVLKSCKF